MRVIHGLLLAACVASAGCNKSANKAEASKADAPAAQSGDIAKSFAAGQALGEASAQSGAAEKVADASNVAGFSAQPQTASGVGAPASATATPPLTAAQLGVAYKTIGLKTAPKGQVINACDEAVTPQAFAAELGGEVGRAYLIVVPGGPKMVTCYGDNPGQILLLRTAKDGGFALIFSDQGYLSVMPGMHKGVHDIAVGGPGFEFPVYAWNGKDYEPSGKIKDSELPTPLN